MHLLDQIIFIAIYPLLWFGCLLKWLFLRLFSWQKIDRLDRKAVLISGCDSGFGYVTAVKLARLKVNVIAACLTKEGSDRLIDTYKSEKIDDKSWCVIQMDIDNEESVKNAANFVKNQLLLERNLELWAIINNAGILGKSGPDNWFDIEDYQDVLDVNCFGHVRVTKNFLPQLSSNGRVVFMISILGRQVIEHTGPYSVSKHAVVAYADLLRMELRCSNRKVITIFPGFHPTPLTSKSSMFNNYDMQYDKLPDSMKNDYPEQWLIIQKKVNERFLDYVSSGNKVEDVADAYIHAVCSKYPQQTYWVGSDALPFLLTSYLPIDAQIWSANILKKKLKDQIEPIELN